MHQLFGKTIAVVAGAVWLALLAAPAAAQAPGPATPPSAAPPDVIAPVVPSPKQVGQVVKDLATGDVTALRRGPLLIHGNYCGIGNRPGTEPIDALDAACMRHDSCTKTGKLPGCSCDERLRKEATGIAQDPATPANIQTLAMAMAASMAVLICK